MPTNYEGDPTQIRSPGEAPIDFKSVITRWPSGGDPRNAASIEQEIKALTDWAQLFRSIEARIFGDGAAGDVSISGTTGPIGLNDVPRYNDLEIQAAADFTALGSCIRVLGTLTWDGKISGNGRAGSVGSIGTPATGGGAASPRRSAGPGGRGELAAGSQAPHVISPYFTSSGSNGTGGDGASGVGGFVANQTSDPYTFRVGPHMFAIDAESGLVVPYRGGRGGGGGGGDSTNSGGGGGESGEAVFIFAREVVFGASCSAESIGGAGGAASAGNCGGGAGGQGGCFVVICGRKTGTPPAVVATGGAAGAKTGTGTNGQAGHAGNTTMIVIELGQ